MRLNDAWTRFKRPTKRRGTVTGEEGAELIELALAMPVFFLLVFGFINFAFIALGWCNIVYASRTASRYLSVNDLYGSYGTPDTQTLTAVNNIVKPFLLQYPSNTSNVTVQVGWTSNNLETYVPMAIVTISITYKIVLPGYTYNGLTISATSQNLVSTPQTYGPNTTW